MHKKSSGAHDVLAERRIDLFIHRFRLVPQVPREFQVASFPLEECA